MAEITASAEVQIEHPADEVFRWVSDPINQANWVSGVRSAEWVRRHERGGTRPDDRWEMIYDYGGKENLIVMEVDEFDSRQMVFQFHTADGKYPIRTRYDCQKSGSATLFRMTLTALSDSLVTALMFRFLSFALRPMMRRQYQKDIEKVKTILESRG